MILILAPVSIEKVHVKFVSTC